MKSGIVYLILFRDDHALNTLLSRCGVLEPGPVNYVKLLERFQDRSDQGKNNPYSLEYIRLKFIFQLN